MPGADDATPSDGPAELLVPAAVALPVAIFEVLCDGDGSRGPRWSTQI